MAAIPPPRSSFLSSVPAEPVLPRYVAARLNPLISLFAPQDTHARVHDLVCNVRSLASEFHEREGVNFLTTNPLYAMIKAALHYEVCVAAEEALERIQYGPLE